MKTSIERLSDAVGYPERVPEGALSFTFRVDGADIYAEETSGRIVLTYELSDEDSFLAELAGYATGRMLKEDATLSWKNGGAFLWQDALVDADARVLSRLFESFMDSCDWWRARVDALRGGEKAETEPDTMVIRP